MSFLDSCSHWAGSSSEASVELRAVIFKRGQPVARGVPADDERPWLQLRDSGPLVGDPSEPAVREAGIVALSS